MTSSASYRIDANLHLAAKPPIVCGVWALKYNKILHKLLEEFRAGAIPSP